MLRILLTIFALTVCASLTYALDPRWAITQSGHDIWLRQNGLPAKEAVSVMLETNRGKGIPPEIHSRIFDPFFTTKEVGKGTGQGVAISHTVIVEKHQGQIQLESEVGKGTTFIIRLPLQAN